MKIDEIKKQAPKGATRYKEFIHHGIIYYKYAFKGVVSYAWVNDSWVKSTVPHDAKPLHF